MNETQKRITDFQVWIEEHPEHVSGVDSDFLDALAVLDEALSRAFLAAFDLDEGK